MSKQSQQTAASQSLVSLEYDSSCRLDKKLTRDELFKRLENLYEKLSNLEQGLTRLESLTAVTNDLISKQLLLQKDEGVKVVTECCIAEILRIFAPDSPYNQKQIQDILWMIAKQLKQFRSCRNPYYKYYYLLLDSLSTVKTIILVSDLDDEDLIITLFKNIYEMVKENLPRNFHISLLDIAQQIIEGCENLCEEIVVLIFSRFDKKNQIERPEQYNMSRDLCKLTADVMKDYICRYISSEILKAKGILEKGKKELPKLKEVHQTVVEIGKVAPEVINLAIMVIKEELSFDSQIIRTIATEAMGEIFAECDIDLAREYYSAWECWLRRKNDTLASVRILCLKPIPRIIALHSNVAGDIGLLIQEKLLDTDEKVRIEALQSLENIDSEFLDILDLEVYTTAADRLKDKKLKVREVAFRVISKIFDLKYNKLYCAEPVTEILEKYRWIPGIILNTLYLEDLYTKVLVEDSLVKRIFLKERDIEKKVSRLLNVFSELDDKQVKLFLSILDRQQKTLKAAELIFSKGSSKNAQEIEYHAAIIDQLSSRFPNQKAMHTTLVKLTNLNDELFFKNMLIAMDTQTAYQDILKAVDYINSTLIENGLQTSQFEEFLNRTCPIIVNKDVVSECLKKASIDPEKPTWEFRQHAKVAEKLLTDISKVYPELLSGNVKDISSIIEDKKGDLLKESLEQLARIVQVYGKSETKEMLSEKRLVELCTTNNAFSKNAAIILLHSKNSLRLAQKVLSAIESKIESSKKSCAGHLAAVAEIAFHEPKVYSKFEKLNQFVRGRLSPSFKSTSLSEWVSFEHLNKEEQINILALRTYVNYARALMPQFSREYIQTAFEILRDIISAKNTPFFRLTAGDLMLKLSEFESVYGEIFTCDDMYKLSLLMQDAVYQVKSEFMDLLFEELHQNKVPLEFLSLLPLAAYDREASLGRKARNFMIQIISGHKDQNGALEEAIVILLYIISKNLDSPITFEALDASAECIRMFVHGILRKDNVNLLFNLAATLKVLECIDGTPEIYAISDLAQMVIEECARNSGWFVKIENLNLSYHSKYFKVLPANLAQENLSRNYLPENYSSRRTAIQIQKNRKPVQRKLNTESTEHEPLSRKKTFAPKESPQKKRRTRSSKTY